jgi:ribosomal protein S18 acetylase RimI-like enzyme
MSELIVRRALQADVPAAARLGTAIVEHHHATDPSRFFWFDGVEESYVQWLSREVERKDAVVLVATRNDVVVGYAYGAIEARDWSVLVERHGALHDLFVVPEERRRGVGRQLVSQLLDELTQLGATLFVLRAMVQNEPAQRLAATFGFRPSMVEMSLSLQR